MKTLPSGLLFGSLLLVASASIVRAQQVDSTPPPDARFKSDILVVAPHPDDESTIAGYLARAVLDEHRRVSVVFTTRGDAGANLIGNEEARSLGEIREIETRQALASIGITHVWVVRAPDTPSPDVSDVLRSLETSHHGDAVDQVVRFIRITRPDVVIAMLPATVVGENHEDHQASSVIATEAFDAAGDPTRFPEQIAAPEDRLYYGNLMEGLHAWQPKKLYYYTDATHFEFMKGKGPEYSMTQTSPARHESYGRIAAEELSYHLTQYGDQPRRDIASGNLAFYEQPLPFVRARSLVGGSPTGDIMENVTAGAIAFAPVSGYRPPEHAPAYEVELGGGWAFYRRFYVAHDLDVMTDLLPPEIGVGSGSEFSVPVLLHNNSDAAATFHLVTQLPAGWRVDSTSERHGHRWPASDFRVAAHADMSVRVRLIAPSVTAPQWQQVAWSAEVNGRRTNAASLKVRVGN